VLIAALLCAVALTGCGNPSTQLIGVPPTLQQSSMASEQALQDQMVTSLIARADLTREVLAQNPMRWRDVADAGLLEVDLLCDRYLAALFTFNREQRAGRQILTAAGAGTAAILGLTGAAGATVALVAASFGIAANVFDAGVNSVLFTVSPTAIRAVAVRGRQAYLETIKWDQVYSRPRMMIVVQGYLAQCTPAALEANIDNAATGAPSVSNIDTALRAAALAAPSSSILQYPSVFTSSPVTPPAKDPPTVAASRAARNTTKAESEFIISLDEAKALQSALGTTPDGDLGPAGLPSLTPKSTRQAISEFNTGQLRRREQPGTGADVMDGKRDIYRALVRTSLASTGLNSAFERGLIGNQVDCMSLRPALRSVLAPVPPPDATDDRCLKDLRDAIKARRATPGMPAPLGREDALDSALFDKGPPPRPF